MTTIRWHPPQFQSGRRMMIADHSGHRLSVRLVLGEFWSARVDGRDLGCWYGCDRAKAVAEEAAPCKTMNHR